MKPEPLIALLFALATVPALADQPVTGVFGQAFGPPFGQFAQLSPDERRAMRERWERAGQEEREQMRQMFQERLRRPGFDLRNTRPQDLPFFPAMERRDEGSFGTGFERRRQEDSDADRRRR